MSKWGYNIMTMHRSTGKYTHEILEEMRSDWVVRQTATLTKIALETLPDNHGYDPSKIKDYYASLCEAIEIIQEET